jgi:hypothetical protein
MTNGSGNHRTSETGKHIPGIGWISPTCPHCGKLIFPWLAEWQPKRRLLRAAVLLFLLICVADVLWDILEMIRGVTRL